VGGRGLQGTAWDDQRQWGTVGDGWARRGTIEDRRGRWGTTRDGRGPVGIWVREKESEAKVRTGPLK